MAKKILTFAEHMRKAMRSQGVTLRDLEKVTEFSYEHMRKIRAGRPLLSKEVCDMICEHLGLDKKAMWALVEVEKMKNKFGEVPAELIPPADDRLKQYWGVLTRDEKSEIVAIAEAYHRKHQLLEKPDNEDELVRIIATASEKLGSMRRQSQRDDAQAKRRA